MYYSPPALSDGGGNRWPILMYHHLERPPRFGHQRGLFVSPAHFRKQLLEMRAAGFQSASLSELIPRNPQPVTRRAIITFDDGFANVLRNALPLLREIGFTAMQFIVAARTSNQWDVEQGHTEYPLMDDGEIREWLAAGQEIGAHTLTHPHLTRLGVAEAKREIFESKARLEDRFQRPILHFCYPYGDVNDAVRDLVIEAGYETACSTQPGSHQAGDDRYRLRRWMVSHRRPVVAAWLPDFLH